MLHQASRRVLLPRLRVSGVMPSIGRVRERSSPTFAFRDLRVQVRARFYSRREYTRVVIPHGPYCLRRDSCHKTATSSRDIFIAYEAKTS